MLFYTHLCLAKLVLQRFRLDYSIIQDSQSEAEYYLGSILPDIRYFANLPREQTHPPISEFINLSNSSGNKAFAIGYLTHLLIDKLEIDLAIHALVQSRFKLLPSKVRSKVTPMLSNALIEFHYLANFPPDFKLSPNGNDLTTKLNIAVHDIQVIKSHIDDFLKDTSLRNIGRLLARTGLLKNARIQKTLNIAFTLDDHPTLKKFMLRRIRKAVNFLEATVVNEIQNNKVLLDFVTLNL
ncbi:MAG: hypothetical protein E2O76_15185 [Caldithrix sp.]|nr:MAG: hypothetical protein E2O76_15185 [Caldithrix sp.]